MYDDFVGFEYLRWIGAIVVLAIGLRFCIEFAEEHVAIACQEKDLMENEQSDISSYIHLCIGFQIIKASSSCQNMHWADENTATIVENLWVVRCYAKR